MAATEIVKSSMPETVEASSSLDGINKGNSATA